MQSAKFLFPRRDRKILNFLVFSQHSYFWLENRPISTLSEASSCDVKSSEEKPHLSRYLLTAKFNYPQPLCRNVAVPEPHRAGDRGRSRGWGQHRELGYVNAKAVAPVFCCPNGAGRNILLSLPISSQFLR